MRARILTPEDKDALMALYESRQEVLHTPLSVTYQDELRESLDRYLNPFDDTAFQIGAFDGDTMVASLSLYCWRSAPYVTYQNLKTDPSVAKHKFNLGRNGVGPAMELMFRVAEATHRFSIMQLLLVKHHFAYQRSFDRYWPEFKERYERTTEAIIPANTKPIFDHHWGMMHNTTWPVDLVVRRWILRDRYRSFDKPVLTKLQLLETLND